MKTKTDRIKNENGSVLVIALIVLMLLTLIGIAITTTASLELQIAGNERLHKNAFYRADGGSQVGFEMLEQNLGCAGGFSSTTLTSGITGDNSNETIAVNTQAFWQNITATVPTTANRDFYFPSTNIDTVPRTDFTLGGNTQFSTGNAIQMVSGYEGKGKAAAGGGAIILYDMFSRHLGINNTDSMILTQWRHVIGQEGDCNY